MSWASSRTHLPSPLLQIGLRPGLEPAAPAGEVEESGWARLDGLPTPGTTVSERLGGERVLVVNLGGAGYAYRDTCPRCSGSLVRGRLDGDVVGVPPAGPGTTCGWPAVGWTPDRSPVTAADAPRRRGLDRRAAQARDRVTPAPTRWSGSAAQPAGA